jgi:hypothetical protein
MHPPDQNDPLAVFRILTQASVPFVIIGGHAVSFHGYIRTTEDADAIFRRTQDSESCLLSALQSIHACWISNERDPKTGLERLVPVSDSYIRAEHLMMLSTDLGFLDLYDYIPGFPETPVEEIFADSMGLGDLRFVSLAWLRKLKAQAARHRDLDDLEHLPLA